MASCKRRIVDSASDTFSHVETIEFVIYNFEARTEKRKHWIESPTLRAHGYNWNITVYPRGSDTSPTDKEYVSCYLQNQSVEVDTYFRYSCVLRNRRRKVAATVKVGPENKQHWTGWPNFCQRKNVLEKHLDEDGSLMVQFDIQIATAKKYKRIWYPEKFERNQELVELYQGGDSETFDAEFAVGNNSFGAHKSILFLKCKKLYEIANESENNDTPIVITSVSGHSFGCLLEFIYKVTPPEFETGVQAIELLEVSDRFECVGLKLYVESVIVENFLSVSNAADLLVFADAHSCALLKEAAMNAVVTNAAAVRDTEGWSAIQESNRLLEELFHSVTDVHRPKGDDEIDLMDVTTLRNCLQKAKLDLDGSREMLVDRWKNYQKEQANEDESQSSELYGSREIIIVD